MPTSPFESYCRDIVERFLLTAVVVDDQPYFSKRPTKDLAKPPRLGAPTVRELEQPSGRQRQDLDVGVLTSSFAKHGMVCGVVAPGAEESEWATYRRPLARADILVLDWRLREDNDKHALALITEILSGDREGRLRLIAVYTGEHGLLEIGKKIVKGLARISHTVTGEGLSGGFGAEFLPRNGVEQEQAALRSCCEGPE